MKYLNYLYICALIIAPCTSFGQNVKSDPAVSGYAVPEDQSHLEEHGDKGSILSNLQVAEALINSNPNNNDRSVDRKALNLIDDAIGDAQKNGDNLALMDALITLYAAHTVGVGNSGRKRTAISRRQAGAVKNTILNLNRRMESPAPKLDNELYNTYDYREFNK